MPLSASSWYITRVKKVIAIIFLGLMVALQTPVGQLLKVPLLVEHFIKHSKKESHSLLAFLEEHYSPGHNDADKEEDEQLPFKNFVIYSIGISIVYSFIQSGLAPQVTRTGNFFFQKNYNPRRHLAGIFHPPR